ncbi:MAG: FadR/GntR family transcriptional regulator [Sphaerochaetaceae bacterium]|jgi:GntR family transcriptional repressor for pyruvate dehydrogenase complex
MITPFSAETKSAQIARKIEEMILNKVYVAGHPLPSQSELAVEFQASSRSIREAFKQLEAKGLVEISQGKRAVVKSNSLEQFVASLSSTLISNHTTDKKLLLDLMQVRTTVEVSAARELSRSDQRSILVKSLDGLTTKMEELLPCLQAGETEAFRQWNSHCFNFHKTLIDSNDNIILSKIYENLSPMLYQSMDQITNSYVELEKSTREHRYLVEALEHGQTDLAVALTLVHLTAIRGKLESI